MNTFLQKNLQFDLLNSIVWHSFRRKFPRPLLDLYLSGSRIVPAHFFFKKSVFDPDFYRKRYSDIKGDASFAFLHFLRHGQFEKRDPTPYFDSQYYAEQLADRASDLTRGISSPYLHFLETCDFKRALDPSRGFDVAWYVSEYPDVNASGINPLLHFVVWGIDEGRLPSRGVDPAWWQQIGPAARRDAAMIMGSGGSISGRPVWTKETTPTNIRTRLAALDERDLAPSIALQDVGLTAPEMRPIVSFDVWDTLIRRDCHPDEIKLQTARWLLLTHFEFIRPYLRETRALFRARRASEKRVAKGKDGWEYRMEQAVRDWIQSVMSGRLPDLDQVVAEIIAHELVAEQRSTRPDEPIRRFIADANIEGFYLSDFYANRDFVDALLQKNGFCMPIGGYISSEHYKTKRSGDLFDHVIAELKTLPADWLHIGDNPTADILSAEKRGIATFHYQQPDESKRTAWFGVAFDDHMAGNTAIHARRIRSLALEAAKDSGPIHSIGAHLAPIALGFAMFVLEEALKNKHSLIFFFTREGQFFKELCQLVADADPYYTEYPQMQLLEVSRRATFAASLDDVSPDSLMRMWSMYQNQSVSALVTSLNLDVDVVRPISERIGLPWDRKIEDIARHPGVIELLKNQEFGAHALARLRVQREQLTTYLHKTGFIDSKFSRRFIVDIGWRGTIQDNLSLVTGQPIDGCYFGLFKFLNLPIKHCSKSGWLFDNNTDEFQYSLSDVAVLEMLFNGEGGSVEEYTSGNVETYPIRNKIEGEEEVIRSFSRPVQMAILEILPSLVDYVRLHGLTSKDLVPLARLLVDELVDNPPPLVAQAFNALWHNELFGAGEVERLSGATPGLVDALSRTGASLHHGLQKCLEASRWSQSLAATPTFQRWWQTATTTERTSVPGAIYRAAAPVVANHLGDRINFFVPAPLRGSGGHRTIFNLARAVSALGLQVECLVDGRGEGIELIEDWLAGSPAIIRTTWDSSRPASLAMATVAGSAKWVAELQNAREKAYLVQDLEPYFNPAGDGFLIAENSYALGLRHYTIGSWLSRVLIERYQAEAYPAGLGTDTLTYFRKPDIHREKAICFLYQPNKPRRLPMAGLEALRRVKRAVPDCTIYVYGSDEKLDLGFDVVQLGLISSLSDLNDLYNRCSAGLCISMTNPSRIPYEMKAAGCIPVDLYRYNNLIDHADQSIVLAHQTEDSIAAALINIMNAEESTLRLRRDICSASVQERTLLWESETIANMIVAQIAGEMFEPTVPYLQYNEAPIFASSDKTISAESFCAYQRELATASIMFDKKNYKATI